MVKDLRHDTIKLLEESIEKTSSDINYSNTFLDQSLYKNKQTGLKQTYKLLHSKENHKLNEKTIFRMGENMQMAYMA